MLRLSPRDILITLQGDKTKSVKFFGHPKIEYDVNQNYNQVAEQNSPLHSGMDTNVHQPRMNSLTSYLHLPSLGFFGSLISSAGNFCYAHLNSLTSSMFQGADITERISEVNEDQLDYDGIIPRN